MKKYTKPVFEVVNVMADTMIASECQDGDCGLKGHQEIVCAPSHSLLYGQSQQKEGYYITCEEWACD